MRIPGLIHVVKIQNADDIRRVNELPGVDRPAPASGPLFNRFLSKRLHRSLSTGDTALPSILGRDFPGRADKQDELEARLADRDVDEAYLQLFSRFILGGSTEATMQMGAQDMIGKLFTPDFVATAESWKAACVLDAAPRNFNPVKGIIWAITGKVKRSQKLLSDALGGDEYGVHAIGIAVHSLVRCLRAMRELALSPDGLAYKSAQEASLLALTPPETLLRQVQTKTTFRGKTYARGTLFQLQNETASKDVTNGAKRTGLAMMDESWSQCPAHGWIPKLLAQVWTRARAVRQLSDVSLAPVGNPTLTLSGSRARAKSARKAFKRVTGLNVAAVAALGASGVAFPSKLTALMGDGLILSHQSTRLWGLTLLIFSLLLLPIFTQPLETRWMNAAAIIALSAFIPAYLVMGGPFIALALVQAAFTSLLVGVYFRYFKAELMTRP